MSLLERLTGTTPEKLEQKADRLLSAGRWGEARLVYEDAQAKRSQRQGRNAAHALRLSAKIRQCRNALAREHRQSADDLLEGGFQEEAREMLVLAIEISAEETDRRALEAKLGALDTHFSDQAGSALPLKIADRPNDHEIGPAAGTEEEYFRALCHTLPDQVRRAYQQYGEAFKRGYIALNQGHFETAARCLEQAYKDAPHPDSHIPLELATAYLNLDRTIEARDLLVAYHRRYPDALPACRLLCEIYWDQGNFDQALGLLDALPPELSASLAAGVLRGETLERSGRVESARDLYRRFLDSYGWDPRMAHRLARICRDMNATEEALDLYRQIVGSARSCHTRIAPEIRHEYAELRFEHGAHSAALLEHYLGLAGEIPAQAAFYYTRIAQIYTRQGHDREARRFRDLARRIQTAAAGTDREADAQ